MRTIVLTKNRRNKWFVRVRVGGEIISPTEDFDRPAGARRAFLAEGDNQPAARMVIEIEGQKPFVVRRGSRVPKGNAGLDEKTLALLASTMRLAKPH